MGGYQLHLQADGLLTPIENGVLKRLYLTGSTAPILYF